MFSNHPPISSKTKLLLSSSSERSAQRLVLYCKRMNLGAVLPKAGLPPQTRNQGCSFTRDWIGAVASHCFLHPTLSLASEQTLKDPRDTNAEVRRVDLANWALWTSPKFITRVKYQLHQGFWSDQRSRNPNHSLPPLLLYYHHQCSAQRQVLHCKCMNLGCSSAEGRSSTTNLGTKAAVLPGIE